MANTFSYSGKQFQVFMAADSSVGTFYSDADWSSSLEMDVEGMTIPTWNPTQEFEMRSGSSRVAQFSDIFSSTKRVITEFTLSGRLTHNVWNALLENVLATSIDTTGTGDTASVVILNGDYNPTNFGHGTSIASATTYEKTLSFYFQVPTNDDVGDYQQSWKLAGCVCTNLSVDADLDSAAGRFNYSATFQTAYNPTMAAVDVSDTTELTAGTNIFLSDLAYNKMSINNFDSSGNDESDTTPVWKTYSLTFDSPASYLGMSTTGTPDVIARAVPELTITMGGSVKYDKVTHKLSRAHLDVGENSYITQYLSDVDKAGGSYDTPTGNTFGATSSSKFGVSIRQAKVTSCEVSSDDVAMVNFEAKVLQPASGDTCSFLAGAN